MAQKPETREFISIRGYFYPAALITLILGRLMLQTLLYRAGFIALTADEFGRTILAAHWSNAPYMIWKGAWLPFYTYFVGASLKLYWNLTFTPRTIVWVCGIISIITIYLLSNILFDDKRIGLASAFLLAANPAHIWLSSTPLTELPYFTAILLAIYWGVKFFKLNKTKYAYYTAFSLLIANGIRYEGWIISGLFSLFILVFIFYHAKTNARTSEDFINLLIPVIIPWLFPLVWILGNYIQTGQVLYFAKQISSYKHTWYGSSKNFGNYIKTLFSLDPFLTLFGFLGIGACLYSLRKNWGMWWYSVIASIPVLTFILLHGGQVEPQGNYIRYLAPFIFLFYPAFSYLLVKTIAFLPLSIRRNNRILILAIIVICSLQIHKAFQFHNDPSADGFQVGEQIKQMRDETSAIANSPVLVELGYWDYLSIQVGANDMSNILFDRTPDPKNRETKSILITHPEDFLNCLRQYQIPLIVVKTPGLRKFIEEQFDFSPTTEIRGYTFYAVNKEIYSNTDQNSTCPLEFKGLP